MSRVAYQAILASLLIAGAGAAATSDSLKFAITAEGVTNAASYASGFVSPGEILVIFGESIGPDDLTTLEVSAGRVTTSLGGVSVLFDGVAAPLVYVSSGQVSAIVPYAVAGMPSTELVVEFQGVQSGPVTLPVDIAVPGVFTLDSSGSGQAAALNQDGSVNSPANPEDIGRVLVLFATGEGQTDPPGQDGLIAAGDLPMPLGEITARISGVEAEILYAGAAPSLVAGVMQVNARVPTTARSDLSAELRLRVDGLRAQDGVTVAVVSRPDPLPPGASIRLYGASSEFNSDFGGFVGSDKLLPFEIRNATGERVLAGSLQDRTVESTETGRLFFAPILRDLDDFSSGAKIVSLDAEGFAGADLDVEFRLDSPGVGPTTASRSADGDVVRFVYDPPLGPPDQSASPWIGSQVVASDSVGRVTIRAAMPDGTIFSATVEGTQAPR